MYSPSSLQVFRAYLLLMLKISVIQRFAASLLYLARPLPQVSEKLFVIKQVSPPCSPPVWLPCFHKVFGLRCLVTFVKHGTYPTFRICVGWNGTTESAYSVCSISTGFFFFFFSFILLLFTFLLICLHVSPSPPLTPHPRCCFFSLS